MPKWGFISLCDNKCRDESSYASINGSYIALKRLNELYDTHSEVELIQLMVKLLNLELKNNDPMDLASEIKAIMHDIDAIGVKKYLPLAAFIKALYLHTLTTLNLCKRVVK